MVAVRLEEVALVMLEEEALIVPLMVSMDEPLFQRKLAEPAWVVAPEKYGTWAEAAEAVTMLAPAKVVAPVPPLPTPIVPVRVMLGEVPPDEAMLPEAVTVLTGEEVEIILPFWSVARKEAVEPVK